MLRERDLNMQYNKLLVEEFQFWKVSYPVARLGATFEVPRMQG